MPAAQQQLVALQESTKALSARAHYMARAPEIDLVIMDIPWHCCDSSANGNIDMAGTLGVTWTILMCLRNA